ncbi:MAG: hypothetical protein RLZZ301_51 [Bacteroidota bacterium]|jgi:GH25 family lysozyme M1 (1,4-beta-N-acetylmuramidase)
MLFIKSIVLFLLDKPQWVLGILGLASLLFVWQRKKWKRKYASIPWVIGLLFVSYVFLFIRYYDRIQGLRTVLTNNSPENLELSAHADDVTWCFGIDVSQYQLQINWDEVLLTKHPLRFVLIRATMGSNGLDAEFTRNWSETKRVGLQRGAYHYYRPYENSSDQAKHFIANVRLQAGDMPPVLDVERMSPFGAANLQEGVKNWLAIVGKHFHCQPIVYTGRYFYEQHLKGAIDGYPLWIASYGEHHQVDLLPWQLYQFSDKMVIHGIPTEVDGNFFKGSVQKLRTFVL